jgi:hypothetical protein
MRFLRSVYDEFLRMFGLDRLFLGKFRHVFEIKDPSVGISSDDIVSACPYGLPARRSGYTTKILNEALNNSEVATVFPHVIVSRTHRNADRLMGLFRDMAIERGFSIRLPNYDLIWYRGGRMAVLNDESVFYFYTERDLEAKKLTGLVEYGFSYIVFDNECFSEMQVDNIFRWNYGKETG